LAEVLQQGKLGSLRDAIPLGQKFEFSNHLFGGDSLQMNDAIDKLDACANYEEARRLTTDYFLQYNWDFDSEAYQQFMAYVERRF
jgi:hypothetical protein